MTKVSQYLCFFVSMVLLCSACAPNKPVVLTPESQKELDDFQAWLNSMDDRSEAAKKEIDAILKNVDELLQARKEKERNRIKPKEESIEEKLRRKYPKWQRYDYVFEKLDKLTKEKRPNPFKIVGEIKELKEIAVGTYKEYGQAGMDGVKYIQRKLHYFYTTIEGVSNRLPHTEEFKLDLIISSSDYPIGHRIIYGLNETIAIESVVGGVCAKNPKLSEVCGSAKQRIKELQFGYLLADKLLWDSKPKALNKLLEVLDRTLKLMRGTAEGLWNATIDTTQALIEMANIPEFVGGLYNALKNYELTWKAITEGVSEDFKTLLWGDPENQGEVLGRISFEIITIVATGGISGLAKLPTSTVNLLRQTKGLVYQATKRGALFKSIEQYSQVALKSGALTQKANTGLKILNQSSPELAKSLVFKKVDDLALPKHKIGFLEELADIPDSILLKHELMGGHAIERHIGKTVDELKNRLNKEPNLTQVSSFLDLKTAELVVKKNLKNHLNEINTWLETTDAKKIYFDLDVKRVVGYGLKIENHEAFDLSIVRVVLKRVGKKNIIYSLLIRDEDFMSERFGKYFYIYNFFGSWFSDDGSPDETIVHCFVREAGKQELIKVIEEGDELINSSEFELEKFSYEANRSFATKRKALEWLKKILNLIKSEYAKQHGKKI